MRSSESKERRRLNHVWRQIIRRCTDPTCSQYDDYGGRGIGVAPRWVWSFDAFVQDMGPRPPGYVIDRINNDGHYTPQNCRWVTRKESNSNRRNVTWVTWAGQRMNLKDATIAAGVGYRMVAKRVQKGMDPILAITTPSRGATKQKEAA